MIELVLEEIDKKIPLELKQQLQLKSYRKDLLEKYGPEAFLDPANLKYPIYDLENGINCHLIYAAFIRSNQYHKKELADKAKKIFNSSKCSEELNVHLSENNELNLIDFTQLFIIEDDTFLFDYIE